MEIIQSKSDPVAFFIVLTPTEYKFVKKIASRHSTVITDQIKNCILNPKDAISYE